MSLSEGGEGALLIDADPEEVGRAALRGGVALAELRTADDGSSVEQLFFQLTAGVRSDHDSDSNRKLQEDDR
jgi:ABC-2 type transport system ATP-binding protein